MLRIELKEITIREVSEGYNDDVEMGAIGYGGRLNIRPPFQREFIYTGKQRDEVIKTVRKDFPLNVIYWVKNSDGNYELLDGQQRTVSICQYINNKFSLNYQFFHNLTEPEQTQILNYKLMVYICEGDDREKLDWFEIINTVGEKLNRQELKNAIYTGPWLVEAKKWFSKTGCPAYDIANDYLTGSPIRQDYLKTALRWISPNYKTEEGRAFEIEDYMAKHQPDSNATELRLYFQSVINWVKEIFPHTRKELMKGLDWGILYNKYKDDQYDPALLETRIVELIEDDEVNNKRGIYEFLLSHETNQSALGLRAFNKKIIAKKYEQQKGICPLCDPTKHYNVEEMEADHIIPWSKGGETIEENCRMLCMHHNRTKSGE